LGPEMMYAATDMKKQATSVTVTFLYNVKHHDAGHVDLNHSCHYMLQTMCLGII